jgi:ribulose kinase
MENVTPGHDGKQTLEITTASTSKAAANSITSSYNVNVIEALKRWEPSQLELGNYLKYLGVFLGNRSQFNQT